MKSNDGMQTRWWNELAYMEEGSGTMLPLREGQAGTQTRGRASMQTCWHQLPASPPAAMLAVDWLAGWEAG